MDFGTIFLSQDFSCGLNFAKVYSEYKVSVCERDDQEVKESWALQEIYFLKIVCLLIWGRNSDKLDSEMMSWNTFPIASDQADKLWWAFVKNWPRMYQCINLVNMSVWSHLLLGDFPYVCWPLFVFPIADIFHECNLIELINITFSWKSPSVVQQYFFMRTSFSWSTLLFHENLSGDQYYFSWKPPSDDQRYFFIKISFTWSTLLFHENLLQLINITFSWKSPSVDQHYFFMKISFSWSTLLFHENSFSWSTLLYWDR